MSSEEKLDTTTRGHHKFSPSKLQYLEACPGYESENTPNAASERGTFLHDQAEKLILNPELKAADIPKLSDEEAVVLENCREFAYSKLQELGDDATLITEEYLPIDEQHTTAGYLDIGMLSADKKRGKILDWKMGQNLVEETANNLQGMAYTLGLMRNFAPELQEVEVIFVLPFIEDGHIDAAEFKASDFPHMRLRIETVVARAKDAYADFESEKIQETWTKKLKATTGGCLFCARKHNCPAVHSLVLATGKKYDPLIVPEVINPALIGDAAAAGKAMKFFQVMEAVSKAYRSAATNKAFNDENWVPEGFMITSMTARRITDKQRFYDTVRPLLTEDEFMQAIDFTLGPIEDAIKAKAPRGQKKAALEELDEVLKANGAVEESEPIIQLRQKRAKAAPAIEASAT